MRGESLGFVSLTVEDEEHSGEEGARISWELEAEPIFDLIRNINNK